MSATRVAGIFLSRNSLGADCWRPDVFAGFRQYPRGVVPPVEDPVGGSLGFVRLVAVRMPMPMRMMTPTAIHMGGTENNQAATASPMTTMKKPTRYVVKEDIFPGFLGVRWRHDGAIVGPVMHEPGSQRRRLAYADRTHSVRVRRSGARRSISPVAPRAARA